MLGTASLRDLSNSSRARNEHPLVEGHPDALLVAAKAARGRVKDAEYTLSLLPEPGDGYERVAPPRKPREEREIICYNCGEPGHIVDWPQI